MAIAPMTALLVLVYNWGDWDSVDEGVQIAAVATKNNKKQKDRKKGHAKKGFV